LNPSRFPFIDMAPRMTIFNRRHGRTLGRGLSGRPSRGPASHLDAVDPVEFSVPSLHEFSHDPTDQYSRRLRISAGGQCTAMNEHGDSSGEDGTEREQVLHVNSSGRLRFGTSRFSVSEMLHEVFLWLMKQSKGKNIKADKSVLAMYHDLFLYGEVPFTIKVRTALRAWPLRPILMWMEFFAAIISVTIYIICSYQTDPSHRERWQRLTEIACGLFFVLDFILNLYSAPVRLYYILSIRGVIDFVCTTPIVLYWTPVDNGAAAILLFFRVIRIMPLIAHVGGLTGGAIQEQIFVLAMYTFGVVFIAAGILQWVDNKMTKDSVKAALGCRESGCLEFFDAFWFMIVTMSTVGYGDITPKSNWGRAVVLCVIISALVILPPQINRILRLASRRPYGGAFEVRKVVGSRFIIVSGNISYRTVQDFLSEFYHPSHDKDMWAFPLRVVIMAPFKPSFELKTLLMHYKDRVEFIQGTPVKDSDLDRVSAKVASAVYLLADSQAKDPEAEDAAQIVRTLAVHRHCGSKVRVVVELLQPEKAAGAIWDETEQGIEIICLDLTRFKLLARSCHIRGLSTFIINLFRSGIDISKPLKGHWMMKYMHGLHQEVFPVLLPDVFIDEQLTFEQAAELIFRKFNVILFGLDIAVGDHGEDHGDVFREVLLYPKGRFLRSSDVGLVIAKDLQTAEQISKLDMSRHPRCLGYRKFICALCMKTGMSTGTRPEELQELLAVVKEQKSADVGSKDGLYEHSIAISEFAVKEGEDSLTDGSLSRKADGSVSRHHGLTSHTHFVKGDKGDGSVHGKFRNHGLISQVSAGKPELNDMSHNRPSKPTKLETLESPRNIERLASPDTPRKVVISLEDAIDMAMSWPPLHQNDKPDPAILERRASEISENLQRRTMNVVKLPAPHIVVCIQGVWPGSLFHFVSHLRTPGLPNPPVVILHPHVPAALEWGCVGFFDHVYFVKGSPSYELDLVRAGVLQARKVVVLAQGNQLDSPGGDSANDEELLMPSNNFTIDVNNVFIAATVERLLRPHKDRVIVELQQETEIQFLQPRLLFDRRIFDSELYQRNRSATYQFAPPYIDGKAFCPAALGFLMYASFYNCQTLAIVDQLICGGQVLETDDITHEEHASDHLVRQLDQIPVPKPYVDRPFMDLFVGMLRDHESLVLGLYRTTGSSHEGYGFVYTNPIPTDNVEATDLVYILH